MTNFSINEICEYDINTDPTLIDEYCAKVDFVFNFAGAKRPQNPDEFMQGNYCFASTLVETLNNII